MDYFLRQDSNALPDPTDGNSLGEVVCQGVWRVGCSQIATIFCAAISTLLLSVFVSASAQAACTADDFANAIDRSGEAIRTTGEKSQSEIAKRMIAYGEARGLPQDQLQERVFDQIYDSRLAELDKTTSDLLLKIDRLGRVDDTGKPLNCANIAEIDAATETLVATIDAKSAYVLAKLKPETATAKTSAPSDDDGATPRKNDDAGNKADSVSTTPKAPNPKIAAKEEQAEQNAPSITPDDGSNKQDGPTWHTDTQPNDAYVPPPVAAGPRVLVPDAPRQQLDGAAAGYSIAEIKEATRGFFGTISTNLASVIEHAFQTSGRPTAYVLGIEGGGAFLAGLRYGKGQLFMRESPDVRQVYWHGPSLGTDFGASGSRTLFLIYSLHDHEALYRSFTGVDGSAYFVGGVGLTLLKGGDVVMAPIRSGLGFRLGANIGYLRFTARPTWNPF